MKSIYIFRKLKLNGYINRVRNEQKMINKFKKMFGDFDLNNANT
jgi:hypothetical protein